MFIKSLLATTIISAAFAAPAFAGISYKELTRLDYRLDRLEASGVIKQGSRLDRVEDRIDRIEDRRDRKVNHGPKDRLEDRIDRRENRWDRRR